MDAEFNVVFPATDPVGHFVVSLAVASNDLVQVRALLEVSSGYAQIANLRQILTHLREVHVLVEAAIGAQPVASFVGRVASACTDGSLIGSTLVGLLTGEVGVGEPRFRNVLRMAREWSTHYPKPNDPALVDTLRTLAAQTAAMPSAGGSTEPSDRFAFADEVMARLAFPFPETVAEERLTQLLGSAADIASAVIHFGRTAVATWSSERLGDPATGH